MADQDDKKVVDIGDINVTMGSNNVVGDIGHRINARPEFKWGETTTTVAEDGRHTVRTNFDVLGPYKAANLTLIAQGDNVLSIEYVGRGPVSCNANGSLGRIPE